MDTNPINLIRSGPRFTIFSKTGLVQKLIRSGPNVHPYTTLIGQTFLQEDALVQYNKFRVLKILAHWPAMIEKKMSKVSKKRRNANAKFWYSNNEFVRRNKNYNFQVVLTLSCCSWYSHSCCLWEVPWRRNMDVMINSCNYRWKIKSI